MKSGLHFVTFKREGRQWSIQFSHLFPSCCLSLPVSSVASNMHSSCLIVIFRRRPSIFLQPAFSLLGDQVCVSHLFYNMASERGFDLDALERQTFFWHSFYVHRRSNLFDKRFFPRTLGCYCVSCELLYASIADALLFVNILVSGIFHGRFAQRLAVNKPCLQIIRRLLWKQATTHSLHNNNPMFAGRTSCQTN